MSVRPGRGTELSAQQFVTGLGGLGVFCAALGALLGAGDAELLHTAAIVVPAALRPRPLHHGFGPFIPRWRPIDRDLDRGNQRERSDLMAGCWNSRGAKSCNA